MKEYTLDESKEIAIGLIDDAVKNSMLSEQETYRVIASEILVNLFTAFTSIRKSPTDLFSDFLKEKGL